MFWWEEEEVNIVCIQCITYCVLVVDLRKSLNTVGEHLFLLTSEYNHSGHRKLHKFKDMDSLFIIVVDLTIFQQVMMLSYLHNWGFEGLLTIVKLYIISSWKDMVNWVESAW